MNNYGIVLTNSYNYFINTLNIYDNILEVIDEFLHKKYSNLEYSLIFQKIFIRFDENNSINEWGGLWYKSMMNIYNTTYDLYYEYDNIIPENNINELLNDIRFNKDIFINTYFIKWYYAGFPEYPYYDGFPEYPYNEKNYHDIMDDPFILDLVLDKKLIELFHKKYNLEDLYKKDKKYNKSLLYYLAWKNYPYIEEIIEQKEFNFNELFLGKTTVFHAICFYNPKLAIRIAHNKDFNINILKVNGIFKIKGYVKEAGEYYIYNETPLEILIKKDIKYIIQLFKSKIINDRFIIHNTFMIHIIIEKYSRVDKIIVMKILGCDTLMEVYNRFILKYSKDKKIINLFGSRWW